MRGSRIKKIRKLANERFLKEGNPKAKTFTNDNGTALHPGDSFAGGYVVLKKRYKESFRKGMRPYLALNRGEMF